MHSPPLARTTPQRIHGMLLGTAIGDALGLFWEGLSPGRQARWRAHRGHDLWVVGRRAWVSDDTEHTVMVVRSLLRQPKGGEGFARELGRSLRWWLVRLPAGVGLGTGRAIVKLWMGWGVGGSGVWSAGNGPMMRVAPIGLWFSGDFQALEATVLASTRLTHSDPRAATGALAVAVTVAMCDRCGQRPEFEAWLGRMREIQQESADSGEWGEVLDLLKIYLEPAQSVQAFAKALLPRPEKGVSGYVYHTLGVVLFLFWRHDQDPVKALEQAVELGGDTDTVAAILGALLGVVHGPEAFPERWVKALRDGSVNAQGLERAAGAMAARSPAAMPRFFGPWRVVRNLVFFVLVLCVGFRRLAPPY